MKVIRRAVVAVAGVAAALAAVLAPAAVASANTPDNWGNPGYVQPANWSTT
ncbi:MULTISPECIES: hypothetical protein [Streptomycetaceae]|uniref:Uncharacterized protein n=1 Tax=Streptantibioticus cattleyicolor (strain ATCC 35852 / DSM 46488 / JCM 4925 / NBRC 14057 / NRRL 8057) TaxID=1003195 RepID=F8JZ39_STREN|nr:MULTISPECIES: hypothetical protein [Streptomycetaceae]AEW94706.1 hypothetical protein SCATT_23350 [Streptantibioticus cattleyicolor NRRL 8057 = DSM 46488]CCB75061.1 exported protein of unknown function [Streptantibioticus cattleyicolor NRRL 8057 = DSM 46488]